MSRFENESNRWKNENTDVADTGQEYVLEATTPLVNKIDSIFYLTNPFQVIIIKNPRLLNKCTDDIKYENIESTGESYSWYGEPKGFVYVFQDTTVDYFNFNVQFVNNFHRFVN